MLCAALPWLATGPLLAKKVDVGGLRLRVVQKGKGSPTVVFDSGLGDSLESWRWVWPDVAKFTGVLLYDRAGLGRSDRGPLPRTSQQIVSELHFLLEAAGARPPYVLVGHSLGGLNVRLFADQYPDEVAALVLVEATPVDYPGRENQLRSEFEKRKLATMLRLSPDATRHEREAAPLSAEQVRELGPPPVPVIVLSSTRAEESEVFREAWVEMQKQLADRVGALRHVTTERSGHYIQFDEPELIVETIRELVHTLREDGDPEPAR